MATHLALAVTDQPMRIDGEQAAVEMLAGAAQLAQGDLELLGLLDGARGQELMDGGVGGTNGSPLANSKPFWERERRRRIEHRHQGRFVDEVQREPGLDVVAWLAGPGAEQVPDAQALQFGQQQPDADLVAGNLVARSCGPDVPRSAGRRVPDAGCVGAFGGQEAGGWAGLRA